MDSFPYIQKLAEIRKELVADPSRPDPSWVRITTITMCSKFLQEIDLPKFRENFEKLGSIIVRRKGSRFRGFEWKMKETAFYNQVSIGYQDQYSRKSVKLFSNGSIQVAGCSDLFDCRRILRQLSFILETVLELEAPPPVADADVKMINTNFSLNASVNLNKIIVALGSSVSQARINYLDEQIANRRSMIASYEYALSNPAEELDAKENREFEASRDEEETKLYNLNAERKSLGDKMPEGKFKVTFDPDRYSAVKVKFVPGPGMKQVTASIFSTGKIIVTGARTLDEIAQSYKILNKNFDSTIFVKPVANPELFGTIMGATFEEWVRVLENKHFEPVKRAEPTRAEILEQEAPVNRMFTGSRVKRDYAQVYEDFYALDSPTNDEIAQFMRVLEYEIMNLDDQDKFEDLSMELEYVQDHDENYDLAKLQEIADEIKNIV